MVELAKPATEGGFETVVSRDGTPIAYAAIGNGPPLVLIGGALNDRHSPIAGLPMAALLADRFTGYGYDRRGRGNSGENFPYAPEREVEDVAALVEQIGEPVFMFGHSSGGALVLEAAAAGVPVRALAVYEPPYSSSTEEEEASVASQASLRALLDEDRRNEAVGQFMAMTGMPAEMIEGMKQTPFWQTAETIAHTLYYEGEVMRMGGDSFVPAERLGRVKVPVLAMAGGNSPDFMKLAGRRIAEATGGHYLEMAGFDHMVPPDVAAAELRKFFG